MAQAKTKCLKAGFDQPEVKTNDWQEALKHSWVGYMHETLGWSYVDSIQMAHSQMDGSIGQYCDFLESQGMSFKGKRVLDIGCGHGTMTIEIAKRGGLITGLEPCSPWREIAEKRADATIDDAIQRNSIKFVDGDAEALPFDSNSFDYILSLQVLEHVKHPRRAINEMKRVLHPEGMLYVSCENYLAFREQHYRVPWLPLLPKPIGAIYLKALKRNPQFLLEHVTYTTCPALIWWFLRMGMWSPIWPSKYLLLSLPLKYVLLLRLHRKGMFGIGFSHCFRHQRFYDKH